MTPLLAQKRGPLSVQELEMLIEGQVSQARIVTIVNQTGVSFQLTAFLRDKLQKAGAGAGVIEALAKANASASAPPRGAPVRQPAVKEALVAPSQSSKTPENRLTGSAAGADAKHGTAKSRPVQGTRSETANPPVDCRAISNKGQLEALSADEIELLRTGCK